MNSTLLHALDTISSKLEQFINMIGRAISWLVLAMVLITFSVVLLRYAFDLGWIALQESISYLHSIVFLLGAAFTLQQDGHVRVDIFYDRLSEKGKAWVDLLGHLFILLPVMTFVIWVSWPYISESWRVYEGSREAGGLDGVYLLKSLILVMAGLLIVQAISMIIQSILKITGSTNSTHKALS